MKSLLDRTLGELGIQNRAMARAAKLRNRKSLPAMAVPKKHAKYKTRRSR